LSDFAEGRRHLLRSAAAWLTGGAVFAATRTAGAWQVEAIDPGSALGLAYAKRCGDSSDHTDLVAQLKAQLAKDTSASSLTATCPICGCPVIVGH
jgi:hypothetical protein